MLINWLIRENCPTATQWRVESKLDGTTMWIGQVFGRDFFGLGLNAEATVLMIDTALYLDN